MIKYIINMSAIALLVMGTTAVANDKQWEFTLGAGNSTADIQVPIAQSGEDQKVVSIDDSSTSINANIAYRFDQSWYVSAGYLDLGETNITLTADTLQAEVLKEELVSIGPILGSGFTFAAGHKYWVNNNIALDFQLGLFSWNSDIESTVNSQTITYDDSGTDIFYGVGLRYQVSNSWGVAVNWQRFTLADSDVDNINFAVSYAF